MRDRATQRLHECLQSILPAAELTGSGDRRWYWASVALLDAVHFPKAGNWCESNWSLAQDADEDSQTGFQAHVSHWRKAFTQRLDPPLGPPPDDLSRVLAELALAGPGTCALRALHRMAPELGWDEAALLTAASQIARGFRSQFNLPEVIALLSRATPEDDSY